ncbi:hypothetical protein jhhlp_007886 [Lomentospora prolificans]|uniref:Cyanovirin-N domain-containing protein n=1 Tax=Lomentospora prolificans TaxID=41688 RepID=A0A2N3N0W4_9PEZI|nr:hypothetical protein jhhlp_007886 [Lomentospora prolificans]
MAFSATSCDIHLKQDHILVATCTKIDGSQQHSELNLSDHIGNDEGVFDTDGLYFAASARNVRLRGGNMLHAELASSDGRWHRDAINLDAFVGNDDGNLFVHDEFDHQHLRPVNQVPQALKPKKPAKPHRIVEPDPHSTSDTVRCNLCKDWPQVRGQSRVESVPQITPKSLASGDRRKGCPTCSLAERIIRKMGPDLASSHDVQEDSIVLKLYPSPQNFPQFQIAYKTKSGKTLEWKGIMHSTDDDVNLSDYYRNVPQAPLLHGDATAQRCISMAQGWLETCEKKHKKCASAKKVVLPARILDIGTKFKDGIKLKTTSGERATYACLSHCWGLTQTLTLTKTNHDELHKDIPWRSLQKTYAEAIVLCRLLGIRYIWIDALCIIQDSPEDWRAESVKMHSYYGSCYVCIAATSAADHDGGCSIRRLTMKHEGKDHRNNPYCVYVRPKVPHIMHSRAFPHCQFFPLLTRAWVYQERRLSPRVLHVTDMELFFECNTSVECECGESGDQPYTTTTWTKAQEAYFANHRDVSEAEDGPFKVEHQWRSFVREFSKLKITKETDRLPALSGLAQLTRSKRENQSLATGQYLAGCWEGSLINDIAWAIGPELRYLERSGGSFRLPSMPLIPNTYRTAKESKPAEYIAPSWSWASVMDQVDYAPFGYSEPLCTVQNAQVTLTGKDAHGQVKRGFLLIKGQILPTNWSTKKSWRGNYAWLHDVVTRQLFGLKKNKGLMWWRDWADGAIHKLNPKDKVYVMPLAKRTVMGQGENAEFSFRFTPGLSVTETAYLVLRLVDGKVDPAVYERVGWACYSGMSGGPDLKQAKTGLLKIV